jgi:hypothetical protein
LQDVKVGLGVTVQEDLPTDHTLSLCTDEELSARSQYRAPELRLVSSGVFVFGEGSLGLGGRGLVLLWRSCFAVPFIGDGFFPAYRLSPFLSFSFPSSLIFAFVASVFRFSHPPAPFRTISDARQLTLGGSARRC